MNLQLKSHCELKMAINGIEATINKETEKFNKKLRDLWYALRHDKKYSPEKFLDEVSAFVEDEIHTGEHGK